MRTLELCLLSVSLVAASGCGGDDAADPAATPPPQPATEPATEPSAAQVAPADGLVPLDSGTSTRITALFAGLAGHCLRGQGEPDRYCEPAERCGEYCELSSEARTEFFEFNVTCPPAARTCEIAQTVPAGSPGFEDVRTSGVRDPTDDCARIVASSGENVIVCTRVRSKLYWLSE